MTNSVRTRFGDESEVIRFSATIRSVLRQRALKTTENEPLLTRSMMEYLPRTAFRMSQI